MVHVCMFVTSRGRSVARYSGTSLIRSGHPCSQSARVQQIPYMEGVNYMRGYTSCVIFSVFLTGTACCILV